MLSEKQLKEKLQAVAQNEFHLSENDDVSALIPDMLLHIGSTDSCLRDDLIYSAFATWVLRYNIISQNQLRTLTQKSLDDQHLFYKIGEANTDSVFRRSFSVLLLPLILIAHRSQPFLSRSEIDQIKVSLLRYLRDEKDHRGFVNEKGWADAVSHSADALDDLVQCTEMGKPDLAQVLEAITPLICVQDSAYIYGEEERLATAVIAILKRQLLTDQELSQWIQGFADAALAVNVMPQKIIIRTNIKNFLQSLYFRIQWELRESKLDALIHQTLHKINPYTNTVA